MKITRICQIKDADQSDVHFLNQLMRVFCSAQRFSFNRLLEGGNPGELIKKVQEKFRLNKRYAEDAVMQAQAIISSQKELLPVRIEGVQGKIHKTRQKIEDYTTGKKKPKKVGLELCLKGLQSRLEKLKKQEDLLLHHKGNGTIPPVVFGGKKNFYERLKNKISKEEWKDLRSNTLYSRGDKSKKGNLNTRIVFDETEQQFYLEVANPLQLEAGKRNNPRLRFMLQIPHKYFKEIINVVLPEITGQNEKGKPIEEYKVYSIELKRKGKKYYVHLTYDFETLASELKWNEKNLFRYCSGY